MAVYLPDVYLTLVPPPFRRCSPAVRLFEPWGGRELPRHKSLSFSSRGTPIADIMNTPHS